MSSARRPKGLGCIVTSRYAAFSLDVQRAVSRPGALTQGVSMICSGTTQGLGVPAPTIAAPSFER